MALLTEMEKAIAERKAQKVDANYQTVETRTNLINKLVCKHKSQIKQGQRQYTEEKGASKQHGKQTSSQSTANVQEAKRMQEENQWWCVENLMEKPYASNHCVKGFRHKFACQWLWDFSRKTLMKHKNKKVCQPQVKNKAAVNEQEIRSQREKINTFFAMLKSVLNSAN